MKYCVAFFIILSVYSCKKKNIIGDELLEGAWIFTKVDNNDGTTVLNGKGDPEILFFFEKSGDINGRLKGKYSIDEELFFFQAEIDTTLSDIGQTFELNNFPLRYYQFEEITKEGIQGKVEFFENGWDSQFSIQFESNKRMWFERY